MPRLQGATTHTAWLIPEESSPGAQAAPGPTAPTRSRERALQSNETC